MHPLGNTLFTTQKHISTILAQQSSSSITTNFHHGDANYRAHTSGARSQLTKSGKPPYFECIRTPLTQRAEARITTAAETSRYRHMSHIITIRRPPPPPPLTQPTPLPAGPPHTQRTRSAVVGRESFTPPETRTPVCTGSSVGQREGEGITPSPPTCDAAAAAC